MKYLKIVDFIGQSVIWLAMMGFGLSVAIAARHPAGAVLPLALGMLCLGWWQMISCLLLILLTKEQRSKRIMHFGIASVYLLLLVVASVQNFIPGLDAPLQYPLTILAVGVPIALAVFYYAITWRWMFPKPATGKFLPHTSF